MTIDNCTLKATANGGSSSREVCAYGAYGYGGTVEITNSTITTAATGAESNSYDTYSVGSSTKITVDGTEATSY